MAWAIASSDMLMELAPLAASWPAKRSAKADSTRVKPSILPTWASQVSRRSRSTATERSAMRIFGGGLAMVVVVFMAIPLPGYLAGGNESGKPEAEGWFRCLPRFAVTDCHTYCASQFFAVTDCHNCCSSSRQLAVCVTIRDRLSLPSLNRHLPPH